VIASLPLAVDGAKTPHLVPDRLAFHHLIVATAVASTPAPGELARREFMLSQAGLSSQDRNVFAIALTSVKDRLNEIEAERRSPRAAPGSSDQLRARQNRLLDDAHARIRAALNADALNRLDHYVNTHVKSRIRIFGEQPATSRN
jgi:hypothetical protein